MTDLPGRAPEDPLTAQTGEDSNGTFGEYCSGIDNWFETTGDSYFKHVNRMTIELSVAEARGSDAELSVRAAAKKSEAVTIADRLVAGTSWIPSPLRIAPAEAEQELQTESIAEDEQFPQAAG